MWLMSTRHAGNYFVPISIRPISIFCCRSYVKLLDIVTGWKKFSLLPEAPLRPEARSICHICHIIRHCREIKSTCARIRSILCIRYNSSTSACTPNFKCRSFTCSTLRAIALCRALNHRIAHCIIQIDQRHTSDRKQKCYHFCTCAIKNIKTEVV